MKSDFFLIIRRLAYYLVFYAAVSLMFYFLISSGLYFYTKGSVFNEASVLSKIVLPSIYAFLSLGVALLVQVFLIGRTYYTEKKIHSIGNLAFFGILILAMILILVYGLVGLKDGGQATAATHNPAFLYLPMIPLGMLCLGEIGFSVFSLTASLKELKEEAEEKAKEATEEKN